VTRQLKYRSRVVSVGPLVDESIDQGYLGFFWKGEPEDVGLPELAEFSVLHEVQTTPATVAPGDQLRLGAEPYDILAVGDADTVNDNFAKYGHLDVWADAGTHENPGDVCVENKPLVRLAPGDEFSILGPDE
jgi:sorbitol-specific phosphotransferase system component IIA